jgi:hypothetical protein
MRYLFPNIPCLEQLGFIYYLSFLDFFLPFSLLEDSTVLVMIPMKKNPQYFYWIYSIPVLSEISAGIFYFLFLNSV